MKDDKFFHLEDIKKFKFTRDETICKKLALRNDEPYHVSRLFHRSLIKYLSGKKDVGISIANEIAAYLKSEEYIDEENYKDRVAYILRRFNDQYQLDEGYYNLLLNLANYL